MVYNADRFNYDYRCAGNFHFGFSCIQSAALDQKYQSVDTSQGTYGVGGMRISGLDSAHGYPDFYRESGN